MSKFGRKIRTVATFLAFLIFVLGAIVQGMPLYCLLWIFIRNKRKRTLCLRASVRGSFRLFVWFCSLIRAMRVQWHDLDKLASLNGVIIIANHPSLVDYVILNCYLPLTTSVMVKEKLTHGFMHFIIKGLQYVNNASAPIVLEEIMKQGDNILIFPEGTRTPRSGELNFHRGFVNLALACNKEIVPIFITCQPKGFLAHGFWSFQAPDVVPKFKIKVGTDINCDEYITSNEPRGICSRRLTQRIIDIYNEYLTQDDNK